ncbi:MAG: type II toxin-antitoxin system RelE/ParE family toxin [Candidatus Gracilibacteria bacterium]|nr:type II toxin-antitoxin system RelE/ParE family toxin [Candidatus Gracilibacteria bacterium]
MEYKIIFNDEKLLKKDFSKIPTDIVNNIFHKLEHLSKNGLENLQVKKLNNYSLCDYRLRVGDYRILFNINENEIIVFRILHRSKLY